MVKEYIEKRIKKVFDWVTPVNWENWNMGKVTVAIEFYPIMYNFDDKTAFIPTGSKDKPAGISTLGEIFLLFFDPKKKGLPFYIHIDLLKKYMRENQDKLIKNQGIDRDFKEIGYNVDLNDLITSCEKDKYDVIS